MDPTNLLAQPKECGEGKTQLSGQWSCARYDAEGGQWHPQEDSSWMRFKFIPSSEIPRAQRDPISQAWCC